MWEVSLRLIFKQLMTHTRTVAGDFSPLINAYMISFEPFCSGDDDIRGTVRKIK